MSKMLSVLITSAAVLIAAVLWWTGFFDSTSALGRIEKEKLSYHVSSSDLNEEGAFILLTFNHEGRTLASVTQEWMEGHPLYRVGECFVLRVDYPIETQYCTVSQAYHFEIDE